MKSIEILDSVLHWAKFGKWTSDKLAGVRFAHESDKETLKRIVKQAQKTICPDCRGHRSNFIGGKCGTCHGTGQRAFDPLLPVVEETMKS